MKAKRERAKIGRDTENHFVGSEASFALPAAVISVNVKLFTNLKRFFAQPTLARILPELFTSALIRVCVL